MKKTVASLLLVSLVILSFFTYRWYQSLPKPDYVTTTVTPPKITPVEKELVPDILTIHFSRSVVPLDALYKEVTKGITVAPAVAGKWQWTSDSQLEFTPSADWPAGQTYTIYFEKDFFSKGTKMAEWSTTFATQPFSTQIENFKLYIDPLNPRVRQAVAELNFNFPVDPASLENKIHFVWQGAERVPFSLKFDEHKRRVYLKTATLALPSAEKFLTLSVSKGIKPAAGPSVTSEPLEDKILIADANSYFKIQNLATSIVRNQQDRPEQVVTIETTLGLKQDELDKYTHVYILPKDKPATLGEETKVNYEWNNPGEVTPEILALSKPLPLNTIPADRDNSTLHSYEYKSATPAYLFVKIDAGMKSMGDFALAKPYLTVLKVPEFPKEITFLHKGALLALGTEEKLSVVVRGLPAVKFNIARVLPDDVNHLITQTGGDFSNPYFQNYNFNQDNISDIFSQIQQFDATDPAKQQYTALDLGKYISHQTNPKGPLGLFLLQAQGWNVKDNVPFGEVESKRLILITDLGLITKDNQDGSHDVFVQSITKGTPVVNAAVSILGKNGVPILTRQTDNQGRANFPSLTDFINEHEPTVYLARNKNDVAFIPYNRIDRRLNFSRFDIGGVTSNAQEQAALTAFIFTDRGIYRPGDTAHIAMIVKQPYAQPQPAGLPLELDILDPRGTTVKTEKITLNDSGYLTFDFPTNTLSPTGQYLVNLYIVKDNQPSSLIGSNTIQVAEFMPDRLRISADFSDKNPNGWLQPSGLADRVGLWNLYGAPAANHRIKVKLLLTPKAIQFPAFPNYIFLDPLFNPKLPPKTFTDTLPEAITNENGQVQVDLKLDRFDKATYQLTVFTEGFEAEGGRSVTTQSTALISPLSVLVGYKPDGDLNYIKQNEVRSVNLIAVNPQLKQQTLDGLQLQLFNLKAVTSLVKNENDTYEYKSIIQTTQLSSNPIAISASGTDYALPTKEIGDYLAVVVDKTNTELARFNFSVVGTSQQPLPKNAELNVKLNKTVFNSGDDIEMQISAPYAGSGLITIERDKVYATQWFTTTTTNSVQKIHIPDNFKGNGYVNIAFVRDLNSPEIFMSPLSYNIQPFSVSHQNQEIAIAINSPSHARPGEVLPITYHTDKPAKIIVYAVDEGILQVTRYDTPDPLQFFFQKRALEVNTLQIVDQILPKFIADREVSAVGGDTGAAELNKNLNPFKRKTEAPVVYWSGIMDSDEKPHQLTYHVPDYFNGTLRLMAVAVAADAVGSASQATEIRGDFVINPNVPTFLAPGDESDITVGIANNLENSGDKATINVQLSVTPQLSVMGDTQQSVVIPEGQERSVKFKVKANQKLGSADLVFTAQMNGKSSKLTSTLSVRPAVAYSTSLNSGYSKEAVKDMTLKHVFYPEFRKVEAVASSNPLVLVTGLQRFTEDYPYGCIEQLVSKGFPWLVMVNQPWFGVETKNFQEKIEKTIQLIMQRQMTNGGFSYWPEVGAIDNNVFASIYAMHFLMEAKLHGFTVPASAYTAGIGYLREIATREISSLDDARLNAYAIYILTRNEIITTNYLTNLQLVLSEHKDWKWQADLTGAYLASTYQLLKSEREADKLMGAYLSQSRQSAAQNDFYNQHIANAQTLYLVAIHFTNRLDSVVSKTLEPLVNTLNDSVVSTVLSGYTSIALDAYYQHANFKAEEPLSISEISFDGKENKLTSATAEYQKADITEKAKQVQFNNSAKQTFFYQLSEAGFEKQLPNKAVNEGIEVFHEITDADNHAIDSVNLGDEVVVHLRVRSIDNQYHTNTAILDLLPGGFEVVRSSIDIQNSMDYADIREDRVIFFGDIGPEVKELTYHIKATNSGKFLVPPAFAASMYNPKIRSLSEGGRIRVR